MFININEYWQIERIEEYVGKSERITVFGGGVGGKEIAFVLDKKGYTINECFDNDIRKEGSFLWNTIPIVLPYTKNNNDTVIYSFFDDKIQEAVRRQIESLGFENQIEIDWKALEEYIDRLSNRSYLELRWYLIFDKIIDFDNPKTFNEKIQWLKVYDNRIEYKKMVDKYEAKKYVASVIGEEYIVPLLGVWDSVDDIDFKELPQRFVLKCTHDSGGVFLVKNKNELDVANLKNEMNKRLEIDYSRYVRELCYEGIPKRIIAEEYLQSNDDKTLIDYKLMCFDGKVKCLFVCTDRFDKEGLKVTFYDREWNKLPFSRKYPTEDNIKRPVTLDKMIVLAEKLSKGIPFVRIDFFEVNEHPYFGEITFYPGSGWEQFQPEIWDSILGSWISLPEIN